MKIAIVHDYITKVGGAQNVLKVLHKLYPEAPIYTLLYDREATKGQFDDCQIITSSLQHKPAFLRKRIKLLLNNLPKAVEEFDFSGYDIVISSSNSFVHGIITRPETLHVCYCYSPMRYAWDWHSEYLRENHLEQSLISFLARYILKSVREWDFLAATRVDRWVAISHTVQKRIAKYYRAESEIIYPPTDIEAMLDSPSSNGDYYLIVSTLTPYKKIDLAIESFNINGKKLLIAGEGSDRPRLESMVRNKNIRFLGYVDDKEKIRLLSGCRGFVFPGEEDFGLTPVEAMACGKPVIALNRGGVAESVIDGKTGYLFDSPTTESFNLSIDKLENASIKPDDCRNRAKLYDVSSFSNKFTEFVELAYKEHNEK